MVYLNWQNHYDKREDGNLWASLLFSENWCAWLASLGPNWYWWPNEWWLWCPSHQWNMQELLEFPSKIYYLSFVWFSSSPSDDWYFQVALTSDQSLSPSWIGGHFNSLQGYSHSRLCTSFALEFILPSEHRMQDTHHSHDLDDDKVANSFDVALQQQKTISKWCPVPSLEIRAILNLSPSPRYICPAVLMHDFLCELSSHLLLTHQASTGNNICGLPFHVQR